MAVEYCHYCDRYIDLDYDVEHFDESGVCKLQKEHTPKNPRVCSFCEKPSAELNQKTHWYRVHQWDEKEKRTIKSIHWSHNAYCDEQCEKWYEQHLEEERKRDPDIINKRIKENPDLPIIHCDDPGLLIDRLREQGTAT